ncbi:MFS transporter [uncultured Sphingomonas sp.]|uniref:MFS transporter n=1 Tax=uncultured Sphingomonas sp. TaxID=158754 RepID=UPI0035CB1310
MAAIEPANARPGVPALMILLMALNIAASVDRMIFAVLAPVMQPALHLSNPQLGMIQGPAFALPYAAALPVAGWCVDRWSARRMLVGSIAIWTAGLALSATASGLLPMIAGRAACGVGQSALLPIAFHLIGGGIRPDRVGRAIALLTGAGTLGRSAAFAIGGLLLTGFAGLGIGGAWAYTLMVLAGANLALLALVIGLSFPDAPPDASPRMGVAATDPTAPRSPALVTTTVVTALGPVVIVQAVTGWVASTLTQAHRLPPSRAAGLIAIATLASPIGHFAGGWAMDRVGARRRPAGVVQALLLLLCIPAVIALSWSGSLGVALAGVAALMMFAGAGSVAGLARVQRLASPPMRGATNGLFLLLVNVIGVGGGPLAVGLLATDGRQVGVALVVVVTVTATIAAVGALRTSMIEIKAR